MNPPAAKCTHHYLVETPDGRVVIHGVCKRCGDERDFEPALLEREAARDARAYAKRVHHAIVRTERSQAVRPLGREEVADGE